MKADFYKILDTVSRITGVPSKMIVGKSRMEHVVVARDLTVLLTYEKLGKSDGEIARLIRRTVSAVCFARNRSKDRIKINKQYGVAYAKLKEAL